MGCRWAAVALVVVGVISSMNLRVEGSLRDEVKKIRDTYVRTVEGGVSEGGSCYGVHQDEYARGLVQYAGKDYDDLEKERKDKYGSNAELLAAAELGVMKAYENAYKQECSLKKQLVCVGLKCKKCSSAGNGFTSYCANAKTIAEAGGWSVRPVNGTLVAALLALFALSF